MHLLLSADGDDDLLRAEWLRTFPGSPLGPAAPGLSIIPDPPSGTMAVPTLVFARQLLPDAILEGGSSIRDWSERVVARLLAGLPEDQPWRLHVEPHYGQGNAGRHRCNLIRDAVLEQLRRRRRVLLRQLEAGTRPFLDRHSLVQLLLVSPEEGYLSVARAPLPFLNRTVLSPFPKGHLPVASDKTAPCRAFAKLVEAEQRLDQAIAPGESCVDLGASPGSWTYVALKRGARVTAVDRAPLRADLMAHPDLRFQRGDAFRFRPETTVDWLLCDVIATPERSLGLLLDWLDRRDCRRFVVTLKFKGTADYAHLDRLKHELPRRCDRHLLTRLCANKNEACAAGLLPH